MKLLAGILCLFHFACAHAQLATFAIRGVTIVDVRNGSLLTESTVLVSGNRITAIGPTSRLAVPEDAKIVDATGRYLIPGLWDMHVNQPQPSYHARFVDIPRTFVLEKEAGTELTIDLERRNGRAIVTDVS